MKFGVVVFPGSNCDHDAFYAVENALGQQAAFLWHQSSDLEGSDVVILPGGFAYGDYCAPERLRAFRQSWLHSRLCRARRLGARHLQRQILLESGLLRALRNSNLKFNCRFVHVRVENGHAVHPAPCAPARFEAADCARRGKLLRRFRNNEQPADRRQMVFRHRRPDGTLADDANPNGSLHYIAGMANRGNVMGMMPHPSGPATLLSPDDGRHWYFSL
jgi:phosphoribosylformylglycinamidine synthase